MGSFWRRLLAVERRLEYYRRTIASLRVTITNLEQQLKQLQGQ